MLTPATDQNGSQVNFYYGAPTPYAESIAPSHHSTYAHYYDDEEDGWEMPNFYNETYMKGKQCKITSFNHHDISSRVFLHLYHFYTYTILETFNTTSLTSKSLVSFF